MKNFFSAPNRWLWICLVAISFSCNDPSPSIRSDNPTEASVKARLKVEADLLIFSDWQQFNETLQLLTNKTREQRETWEKEHKFTSLHTIYERVVDEEIANSERQEALVRANPELAKTMSRQRSQLAAAYSPFISVGEYGTEVNISFPSYVLLLNPNAMVVIGGTLIQFTKDKAKSTKFVDAASVNKLKIADKDNIANGIYVSEVKTTSQLVESKKARATSEYRCDLYPPGSSLWLTSWAYSSATCIFDTQRGTYYENVQMSLKMRFLKDGTFGWVDHRTETYSSSGKWGISGGASGEYNPYATTNVLFDYNTGRNFYGKTAQAFYNFVSFGVNNCPFPFQPFWVTGTYHDTEFVGSICKITI